ncbi:unnamed protein product [Musa textilis]
MSATVINGGDAAAVEVEFAACDCCGLMEECTPAYIAGVRERHGGRWICGLCAEAVQDEIRRSGPLISLEEAMGRHASFRRSFRSAEAAAVDPAEQLIAAVRQLLRRNLDSPRAVRSNPGSPRTLVGPRTGRGFPTLICLADEDKNRRLIQHKHVGQRRTFGWLEQEQTHPQEYPGHERLGMTLCNLEQETLQQLLLGHPPLKEKDLLGLQVQQDLFCQLEQPPVKHVALKQTIALPTDERLC